MVYNMLYNMCAGGPGPALLYFAAAADWHRGGAGRARGTIDLGGGRGLVRCKGPPAVAAAARRRGGARLRARGGAHCGRAPALGRRHLPGRRPATAAAASAA